MNDYTYTSPSTDSHFIQRLRASRERTAQRAAQREVKKRLHAAKLAAQREVQREAKAYVRFLENKKNAHPFTKRVIELLSDPDYTQPTSEESRRLQK